MKEALDFLKKDKVMKKIIEKKGEDLKLIKNENYFDELYQIIIFQQLSGKAANSILKKFQALFLLKQLKKNYKVQVSRDKREVTSIVLLKNSLMEQ